MPQILMIWAQLYRRLPWLHFYKRFSYTRDRLLILGRTASFQVYVEHGALRDELWSLQRKGVIELVTFPYESKNRRIKRQAIPSAARIGDLGFVTIGELQCRIGDFSPSNFYGDILRIVGQQSRRDALHIDSAYKSDCKAFFSRDKKDILSNRVELEPLLGIRFFHPDEDWNQFLAFLRTP